MAGVAGGGRGNGGGAVNGKKPGEANALAF